jgi:uncharacterized protein YcgL (UPF0745 family)
MDDGNEDAAAADVATRSEPVREANVSVEQIVIALRQKVDQNPHRSQQRPDSPFRAMLVTLAERDDRAAVENAAVHSVLRKQFYEAQVCPALTRSLCETSLYPFMVLHRSCIWRASITLPRSNTLQAYCLCTRHAPYTLSTANRKTGLLPI